MSDKFAVLVGFCLLIATPAVRADDPPPQVPASWPDPARLGPGRPAGEARPEGEGEAERGGNEGEPAEGREKNEEGKREEKDGPLDPFFDLIDPARFQRGADRFLAARIGEDRPRKVRPEVPEIGEPVFFDLTRPLGAARYSNELNYLLNTNTANAPTQQVIEYEYAFADWNAVELDLAYFNGRLELLTPFYQRTLGVSRGGRVVRGVQLSPDIYLRSGFLGGSAVYMLGYKPGKESRFSALSFLGANRALIGGFGGNSGAAVGAESLRSPIRAAAVAAAAQGDRIYGSWRPTFNIDLFYKLSESISLGIENDLFFQSGRGGEYFSFPFVTWEAGQHAFFQAGAGYYHFESRDQFAFLLHLNFVNPSVNAKEEQEERDEQRSEAAGEDAPAEGGPIRRWLARRRSGG